MDDELPDFDRFGHDEAWRLGSRLVERCRADGLPVVISIHLGEQRVFHAALPGSSADNDAWVDRKTRVVRRFDRSSLAVAERYFTEDRAARMAGFGLSPAEFAPGEGAVPIRVHGTQVGVLSLSGLEPTGDHVLVVSALQEAAGADR
jgi:uncharacterized protein (UPF0303 family)